MKIVTLNLAGYKNWREREAKIVAYLNETKSDVVFLQEVKFDTEYSPYSQSRYLNSLLDKPYTYSQTSVSRIFQSSQGGEAREGLAVLSTYPIVQSEVVVLKKRQDDKHTRIIQKVSLEAENRIIDFTNVHFSNNQYSHEQLEETLRITKDRNETSIILGDFNIFGIHTVSNLYSSEYIASIDFSQYVSFPSENATLDYVLMPHNYTFTSLSTNEGLSDHNAISFEFVV